MDLNNSNSPSCPICENEVFPKFSVPCDCKKPNNSKSYEVYWCPTCDYGLVWPRPSREEIADFYVIEDYYTHKATTANLGGQNVSFFDRLMLRIGWHFDAGESLTPSEVTPWLKEKELTICEIGCGNGNNLSQFHGAGFSVFGVEPDPAARELAQKITVNIFNGTAEELPETIVNRKYDVVLMSHVLEHCLDINAAVLNAKGILKEGGVYLVETPNSQNLGFKAYQGGWPWSDIPRHLNFFTTNSLNKILKKHGFEVEQVKYYGFCRQFHQSWLTMEDEIWSAFSKCGAREQARPNFRARAWKMLFRSAFASKASKYDSVRLLGINS